MPEKLKDLFFSDKFIAKLGDNIQNIYPSFDQKKFNHLIYSDDWKNKALKQKMRHTTHCLATTLPEDYATALKILVKIAPNFERLNMGFWVLTNRVTDAKGKVTKPVPVF